MALLNNSMALSSLPCEVRGGGPCQAPNHELHTPALGWSGSGTWARTYMILVERGKVVEGLRDVGMLLAEGLLPDAKGALVHVLRLTQLALRGGSSGKAGGGGLT